MANDKGKAVAVGKDSYGKRKRNGAVGGSGDKSHNSKRKNRSVLQFFEDAADVDYDDDDEDDEGDGGGGESDDSVFDDDDFMEEIFEAQQKANNEMEEAHNLPFIPKEEEMDEEEFDKMMEERYKKRSSEFIRYAGDDYEAKRLVERDYHMHCPKDPTIWKVKCIVGRERQSAFCLMQKFVDLQSLGTKLLIISAFSVDHIKGFIYIEADKQCDINEACKGLSGIYYSRLAPVPKIEVSHLLSAQIKHNEVSEGTWAYVKNGKYKGDLAQVVYANNARKRATVKLIPRIDFQALAAKFGGGVAIKKTATAAPRLISPSELEEFRPLIQYRRDRDTGKVFQNLDGMMLKDGYLYKKVSIDSLSCWGVVPSEEERLKFQPSESNESADLEWLSQLYGERKKKRTITAGKGGDKGEGSSVSSPENSFELYELVCFGRKDFGLIVGMEKDDHFKILKEGSEGPAVVTVERRILKNGPFDMKFTALDQSMKIISLNDTVRVSEGPSKDRKGIVKKIYRGVIFLHDENEAENGGYFCSKSQLCEKIKVDVCDGKDGGSGASGFEEFPSSPKSPLSPKKSWQAREQNSDFKRGDKDGMFAVGQTLRIRVGPLKGYLCRVLAIRYSDITVKLDSQQKILTVKGEHLAEVRGKSFATSTSDNQGASSFKPFDPLGTEGGSGDWISGAGTSAEGDKWNAGGVSAERSSWPSFPATGTSLHAESNPANAFGSGDNDANKDEDSAWGRKVTSNQNSSWGLAAAEGNNEDCWNKAAVKNIASDSGAGGGWDKAVAPNGDTGGSLQNSQDNWGNAKVSGDSSNVASASWGKSKDAFDKGKDIIGNSTSSWGVVAAEKNKMDSWGNSKDGSSGSKSDWGKSSSALENTTVSWGNASGGWTQKKGENTDEGSGWKKDDSGNQDQTDCWNKPKTLGADGGSSWNKQGRGCPSDAQTGGSSWSKEADQQDRKQDGGSLWGKQDGGSSWSKEPDQQQRKNDGGSSWGKQDGGSSWGKQDGGSSWSKEPDQQQRKSEGGASWGNRDGGSSWSKQADQKDNQEKPWASDGGRGSGGRWGRGGGRGGRQGDSVQYGRGSFEQASGWNKGPGNNWNNNGSSSGNPSSWKNDQEGTAKTSDGHGTDCWKEPNASRVDTGSVQTKEWSTDKETGSMGDQGTGWNSGNKDTNWGQKGNWNSGSSDRDGNNGSGWGKKSNWNSGSSGAGESNDSNWGKKGNWNSGSNDANQESSWGKKSDLNSVSEDQPEPFNNRNSGGSFRGRGGSDRGSFRGRGGSDRGGFGGRGRSDRGGYGGRGRSDRGGFGGRGGSDREGFGGRGRYGGRGRGGRDQGGGWNSNDSGDYKSFDSNQGAKNSGEWSRSNDGAGSWSQGGGSDKGNWQSWKSGNGGSSSRDGRWSSQGSGWNNSNTTNEVEGPSDQGGGWNKGAGGSAQSGGWGSQGSGWNSGKDAGNKGNNEESNISNEVKGPNDQGVGGKSGQAGGWGNQGSDGDQRKAWNQSNAATDGGQSKDAGEGSSGGWGKTAGSDGGGKGGW